MRSKMARNRLKHRTDGITSLKVGVSHRLEGLKVILMKKIRLKNRKPDDYQAHRRNENKDYTKLGNMDTLLLQ